jgi:sigma-B regulation protein RsbQ
MADILQRNNVRFEGRGDKVMVFAHGFGCDQNVWRHVIKTFEADYKLVLFDFVGCGQSDLTAYSPEKYGTLDGYAQDILDIMACLELKDAIFVGHSVACMIALKAAINQPDYFSKLIFVAPSPCYINDGDYVGGMEKEDLDALLTMMDSNYLGWSSTLAPQVIGNAERPELGDELTANFCATDPDIARAFARVTFLSDNRADLPKLTVPSLTLQCADDILAPVTVGEYIQQHTPHNTLVNMKATGHCPHLSDPDETAWAIYNYIHLN